jgi:hypothetical protein
MQLRRSPRCGRAAHACGSSWSVPGQTYEWQLRSLQHRQGGFQQLRVFDDRVEPQRRGTKAFGAPHQEQRFARDRVLRHDGEPELHVRSWPLELWRSLRSQAGITSAPRTSAIKPPVISKGATGGAWRRRAVAWGRECLGCTEMRVSPRQRGQWCTSAQRQSFSGTARGGVQAAARRPIAVTFRRSKERCRGERG